MPSYRRLQQYAIIISIISVIYNGAEGGVSVGFGAESSSRSLIFFGIQSGIEVLSSLIVLWRFKKIAKPGEEFTSSPEKIRIERIASGSIGALLIALAFATEGAAIAALTLHQTPESTNSALIISASCFVFMVILWIPKVYLAKALNSSAMHGEAVCSLSCIQITIVLFIGALIHRVWKGGWWVDSAASIILGLLFGWEGYKIVRWVRDPKFDGGCCGGCKTKTKSKPKVVEAVKDTELGLGESGSHLDLCSCCSEKTACKEAGSCRCEAGTDASQNGCCTPVSATGTLCCTQKPLPGPHPEKLNVSNGDASKTEPATPPSCDENSQEKKSCCDGGSCC